MEQKDIENPERFLQQQNTIPLEVQQIMMNDPNLRAIIEGLSQQVEVQKNGNTSQENVQNVRPDASIPQAANTLE